MKLSLKNGSSVVLNRTSFIAAVGDESATFYFGDYQFDVLGGSRRRRALSGLPAVVEPLLQQLADFLRTTYTDPCGYPDNVTALVTGELAPVISGIAVALGADAGDDVVTMLQQLKVRRQHRGSKRRAAATARSAHAVCRLGLPTPPPLHRSCSATCVCWYKPRGAAATTTPTW